jgi:hypothetical protein
MPCSSDTDIGDQYSPAARSEIVHLVIVAVAGIGDALVGYTCLRAGVSDPGYSRLLEKYERIHAIKRRNNRLSREAKLL